MSYRFWRGGRKLEHRAHDEKAYRRQSLDDWDAQWDRLSVKARHTFVHEVKVSSRNPGNYSTPSSVSIDRIPPPILKELAAAGFVEVRRGDSWAQPERVSACYAAHDFASRIRTLRRHHLLAVDQPSEIAKYIDEAFFRRELTIILESVLRGVGIVGYLQLEQILDRYVIHHRWPGWVAESLKIPVAQRIIDVVREAGTAIPLTELPGRIETSSPAVVRSVANDLVGHLALFEDLHPETWELMVGLLPAVREKMILASQQRQRPNLIACDHPKEIGPDGSVLINDLRAVLLEVASGPPRLRQDDALYQKDSQRFLAALEPMSPWLVEPLKWQQEVRLSEAITWARELQLVKQVSEDRQIRLHLSSKGHAWVSSGFEEQYTLIYDRFRAFESREELISDYGGFYSFSRSGKIDVRFLGAQVTVLKVKKGENGPGSWAAGKEDRQALRQHLDRGLAELEPGVFYRLDSIESHVAFGVHNPMNRGLAPDQVAVLWAGRPVPPIEEEREEKGKLLIRTFVCERLIPLGCFRAAVDDAGSLCIAREPRYDAYFGRKIARTDLAPTSEVAGRVVVQPDFSVIVIGQNLAAVADLAPFCERAARGSGQGAMVLKITRESVVKAVKLGLTPAEIVARLERHTSKQVPANVLREVKDWSNWVRRVTFSRLTVLRCPDPDTVDRVIGVMGRLAERVNDTLVALDRAKLTPTQRDKLKNHGIIVQSVAESREGELDEP